MGVVVCSSRTCCCFVRRDWSRTGWWAWDWLRTGCAPSSTSPTWKCWRATTWKRPTRSTSDKATRRSNCTPGLYLDISRFSMIFWMKWMKFLILCFFRCSTPEEKEAWIDALFAAMTELVNIFVQKCFWRVKWMNFYVCNLIWFKTRRKSSLRVSPIQPHSSLAVSCDESVGGTVASNGAAAGTSGDGARIGRTPPTLIKPDSVNRCASCDSQFTVMRRKHHCHACGRVSFLEHDCSRNFGTFQSFCKFQLKLKFEAK